MTIQERVRYCRTIEKLEKDKGFCDRVGIVNRSMFQGKTMNQKKSIEGRKVTCQQSL